MLVLIAETVSSGISCARLRVIILLVLGSGASMFHLFFEGIFKGSGSIFRGLPRFLVFPVSLSQPVFDSAHLLAFQLIHLELFWAGILHRVPLQWRPGGARTSLHQILTLRSG